MEYSQSCVQNSGLIASQVALRYWLPKLGDGRVAVITPSLLELDSVFTLRSLRIQRLYKAKGKLTTAG